MEVLNNEDNIATSKQLQSIFHVAVVPENEKSENIVVSKLRQDKENCNTIHVDVEPKSSQAEVINLDVKRKLFISISKSEKNNWIGLMFAFLAGVLFTLGAAAQKAIGRVDPMELLVLRSMMQVATVLPIALCKGESLIGRKGHRLMIFLQGLFGGLTLVMVFYSFLLLALGDATTILFSSSVIVMIMSFLFLREPCGFYRIIIICFFVIGIVLISKPSFIFHVSENQKNNVLGYIVTILGTVFMASNIILMRKCKDIHYSTQVLQLSMWSLVIATALVIWNQCFCLPRVAVEWCLAFGVGLFGVSGQILIVKAVSLEEAGRVVVVRSLDIVLAFLFQVYLFGEKSDYLSIIGSILVTACVISIVIEERVLNVMKLICKWKKPF